MTIKAIRFISLLCAALVFGLAIAHVLEIPGKRELSGPEWLKIQHTFYGGFAVVGGIAEILGLLTTAAILFFVWKHRATFVQTLVGALCFVGMLLAYWFGNRPVNAKISSWTPSTLPADWASYRDYWDYAHTTTAVFGAIALVILLIAALHDTPTAKT